MSSLILSLIYSFTYIFFHLYIYIYIYIYISIENLSDDRVNNVLLICPTFRYSTLCKRIGHYTARIDHIQDIYMYASKKNSAWRWRTQPRCPVLSQSKTPYRDWYVKTYPPHPLRFSQQSRWSHWRGRWVTCGH